MGDVSLFFDVDGVKLEPDGPAMRDKPTLVLLHGGPGYDHSGFKPQFKQLSDLVQIIYVDLRGHGRSDRGPPQSWCLRQWAADLQALFERLGIIQPVVLGLSFGCEVAMTYAINYPLAISRLILVSATARLRLDRSFAVFRRLGGPDVEAIARQFWLDPSPKARALYFEHCVPLYGRRAVDPAVVQRATMNADVAAHYNRPGGEAQTMDLLPHLHRISCPTLVLVGEDDPITTVEDAQDIAAALESSPVALHVIPGCRHNVFRDDPEYAFGLLRKFLQN